MDPTMDPTMAIEFPIQVSDPPDISPQMTVGIIVGMASLVTLLVILLSIGFLVIRHIVFRRQHPNTALIADIAILTSSQQRESVVLMEQNPLANIDQPDIGEPVFATTAFPQSAPKPSYTEGEIRMQHRHTHLGIQQFPRADLLLLEFLGEGEYGPVYRGEAYGLGTTTEGASRVVTVKMLSQVVGESKRIRFEQDIALLSSMNHVNIVGILAVCTQDAPECILLDAGRPGDLLQYIRDKQGDTGQRLSTALNVLEDSLEFLKIADDVSLGMAYLASQNYVIKDLALRNCIISYNGVVKVANFALGPSIYPEAYHYVQGNSLPIRWMPPEAIASGQFTLASDIWAHGILIWELFSYGELPYPDKKNEEVIHYVGKEFGKPAMPEGCMEDAYLVMCSCWELEPLTRSTFLTLHEHLSELKSELTQRLNQ